MNCEYIDYGSKRVFVIDFTGVKLERQMISLLDSAFNELRKEPVGSDLRILIDLTGSFATPGYLEAAKKYEKEFIVHYKVRRALLGITGAKEIILKGFNLFAKQPLVPFKSREEALEYLVK